MGMNKLWKVSNTQCNFEDCNSPVYSFSLTKLDGYSRICNVCYIDKVEKLFIEKELRRDKYE
tara:strand:+ start:1091 stop:1276 length:186 start_codon:yes stop_codon:yes gene_type:complete